MGGGGGGVGEREDGRREGGRGEGGSGEEGGGEGEMEGGMEGGGGGREVVHNTYVVYVTGCRIEKTDGKGAWMVCNWFALN